MWDVKMDSSQESGQWWGMDRSAPRSCLLLSVKKIQIRDQVRKVSVSGPST